MNVAAVKGFFRTVFATARKEWINVIRYPTWAVSLIVWPILFPVGSIFASWALAGPDGSGLEIFASRTGVSDAVAYLVIGNTVWMWVNLVLWNVGTFLRMEQMRGTLESIWLTPAERIGILIGSSLTQFSVSLTFILITVVEVYLIFGSNLMRNPLATAAVILVSVPAVYGLAMAFASLVIRFKDVNGLVNFVRGVVMIFVGVSHPIAVLPEWMQRISLALPFTYTIEGLRLAMISHASLAELQSILVKLALFGIMSVIIGLVSFRLMERATFRTGGLSHY